MSVIVKASNLPKDKQACIRISSEVKKALEEAGYSVQSLFDEAVDAKIKSVKLELGIKVK